MRASVPCRRRRLLVAVATAVGYIVLAGCAGTTAEPTPTSLTLTVVGRQAPIPSLRIRFTPDVGVKNAERVQTVVMDNPRGTIRAVLRSPFRSLDVAVEEGEAGYVAEQLRSRLAENPLVAGVDTCPCPEEPPPLPTKPGIYRLARSCAASGGPGAASGCVNKFIRIQPIPLTSDGKPSHLFALVFEASSSPANRGHRVKSLKAAVSVGGLAKVVWIAPTEAKTLKSAERIPLTLGSFETMGNSGVFSAGKVEVEGGRQRYAVSTAPDSSVREVQLEGAAAIAAPITVQPQERYEIVVQYR